jgi:hypothetical protein
VGHAGSLSKDLWRVLVRLSWVDVDVSSVVTAVEQGLKSIKVEKKNLRKMAYSATTAPRVGSEVLSVKA